jgi:hypothetical protein
VKEGWEPLCRFLGVPVPENDFPHLNDAKQIRRMILAARVVGWAVVAAFVAGIAGLVSGA